MIEFWKAVVGADGYEVSSMGRVRSVPRTTVLSNRTMRYKGKILATNLNSMGYPRAWVSTGVGQRINRLIHIMVAEAFLGPRPEGREVCHNDGSSKNAEFSNLRYDTPSGNAADKIKHGTNMIGANHPSARLSELDVSIIRVRLENGDTQRSIANDFNVSRPTVQAIYSGRSWV